MKPITKLLITLITEAAVKAKTTEEFPFSEDELRSIHQLIQSDPQLDDLYTHLKYEIYKSATEIAKTLRNRKQPELAHYFPEYFI